MHHSVGVKVVSIVLLYSRVGMGTIQRESECVVVTRCLELRNEGELVSARVVQGPERIEPGLVNLRINVRIGSSQKRPLFSYLRLGCLVDFAGYLTERFVVGGPQAIKRCNFGKIS